MRPVLLSFNVEPLLQLNGIRKNHNLTRIGCEPVATGAADQWNYDLPYLCCQLNSPFNVVTTKGLCNGWELPAEDLFNIFCNLHMLHLCPMLLPKS